MCSRLPAKFFCLLWLTGVHPGFDGAASLTGCLAIAWPSEKPQDAVRQPGKQAGPPEISGGRFHFPTAEDPVVKAPAILFSGGCRPGSL